ncbi:MAG: hypothetical protein OQL08_04545 [Gammaproteobacteria bacterium]|nr:hypothetical protein [Gammaproteobacteria bacterium]
MADRLIKAKGRRTSGVFVPLPAAVLTHPNFISLSHKAVKLLLDMLSQLRLKEGGTKNNGDICIAWSIMSEERGWKSKETLNNARNELLHYGFIQVTRQGGRKICTLYAITWWAIDECNGKLDVAETKVASNLWKEVKPPYGES